MKNPKLSDYFFWKGKMAKVIGIAESKTIIFEMLESNKCPKCGEDLGVNQISMIPTSPLFQENAEPIQTFEKE